MDYTLIPIPTERKVPANTWKPPAGIRIISADDHNMEAENLWQERLPAKFKDRAPKHTRDKDGIWHMEIDGKSLDVPGIRANISEGCDGFSDINARFKAMDAEHVDASLIFHGRLQALNMIQDHELYTACIDVYNEWLAEYLRPHAKRLIGIAVLPTFRNPAASRDYMQKIKQLGFKAFQMPSFPKGIRYNSMEMEPLWSAIEEADLPLSFHIGAYLEFSGNGSLGANLTRNLGSFRPLLGQLTFAGVFERHPKLRVVFTEGGAGWVSQTLTDMDAICREYYSELKPKLARLPSFYWHRQCYATFMDDPTALDCIDRIGADNIMWSLDYPHAEGCHGYSGEIAQNIYERLGHERAAKVLGGNAARVWKI
jgi:predicted TIM-barrel fold metal-dependent hydrolase